LKLWLSLEQEAKSDEEIQKAIIDKLKDTDNLDAASHFGRQFIDSDSRQDLVRDQGKSRVEIKIQAPTKFI